MEIKENTEFSSAHNETPQKSKSLEPLNNTNPDYENLLLERRKVPICDKLARNIVRQIHLHIVCTNNNTHRSKLVKCLRK